MWTLLSLGFSDHSPVDSFKITISWSWIPYSLSKRNRIQGQYTNWKELCRKATTKIWKPSKGINWKRKFTLRGNVQAYPRPKIFMVDFLSFCQKIGNLHEVKECRVYYHCSPSTHLVIVYQRLSGCTEFSLPSLSMHADFYFYLRDQTLEFKHACMVTQSWIGSARATVAL